MSRQTAGKVRRLLAMPALALVIITYLFDANLALAEMLLIAVGLIWLAHSVDDETTTAEVGRHPTGTQLEYRGLFAAKREIDRAYLEQQNRILRRMRR